MGERLSRKEVKMVMVSRKEPEPAMIDWENKHICPYCKRVLQVKEAADESLVGYCTACKRYFDLDARRVKEYRGIVRD